MLYISSVRCTIVQYSDVWALGKPYVECKENDGVYGKARLLFECYLWYNDRISDHDSLHGAFYKRVCSSFKEITANMCNYTILADAVVY